MRRFGKPLIRLFPWGGRTPTRLPSADFKSEVTEAHSAAQEQLLNNFDQEVIEKVCVEAGNSRNRFEEMLWLTTRFYPEPLAHFDATGHTFTLEKNPFPQEATHYGPHRMGRNVEDANTYHIGHALAQRVLEQCCSLDTPPVELCFHLDAAESVSPFWSRTLVAPVGSCATSHGSMRCYPTIRFRSTARF